MAGERRVRAQVHGRVQMVGFRAYVMHHAGGLGVNGTVANLPDGSVECVMQAEPSTIERMLGLIQRGPTAARVERVDIEELPVSGTLPPMRVTS